MHKGCTGQSSVSGHQWDGAYLLPRHLTQGGEWVRCRPSHLPMAGLSPVKVDWRTSIDWTSHASHTALNAAVVVGATSINAPASPFPPPAQLQRDSRVRASGRHNPSGPRGATRCPEVHGQSRAPLGYLMPPGGGHMARGKDLFPLVWVPRVHITDIFFYKFY